MSDGFDPPRPNSTRARILIPFAIVTLIWGSTWLVIRDQISVVPPSWSVTYRFVVASVAMAIWATYRRERWRLDARGLMFAGALGLLQFSLNFNFVYRAEAFITSGLVAVIFALLLIPNAFMARVFLGQRLGAQLLFGSAVAMAGIVLLLVHEARSDPAGPARVMTGVTLTLLGILSASCANVMQATRTATRYPMAPMLAISMMIGAVGNAAFAWWLTGPPVIEARIGYFAGILYLGLFASALAFALYYNLIRTIGPAKAAYSSVIVPVIAMILSTVFEDYRWSTLAAAGSALAGVGLVIALRARRPAR